ncbi:MAG: prolyl oligopeptidase family serine peptidase [Rhizomicrobium sp.]
MIARTLACFVMSSALVISAGSASTAPLGTQALVAEMTSFPFASDLVPSPTDRKLAWVLEKNGERNVFVATALRSGGFRSQQVTAFAGDAGMQTGQIAWAGHRLVFVRGTAIDEGNAADLLDQPNPPAAAEIWTVPAAGGHARKIALGRSPAAAPGRQLIAYISPDKAAWLLSLEGAGRPYQVSGAGEVLKILWSPDGSKLAMVLKRKDHALIGVFDVGSRTLRLMSPSFEYDREPEWSPDGRQIAWIRSDQRRAGDFLVGRSGPPWALWIADAATGQGRQVFVAPSGPGSVFRGLESSTQSLRWMRADRIVFPWERNGWLNLYALDIQSGGVTPLVQGEFEVFTSEPSPDRESILYMSNRGDLDRYQVARVDLSGRDQLVRGEAADVYDSPKFFGHDVALMEGDAFTPLHPAIVAAGASKTVDPIEWSPNGGIKLVQPRAVVFTASDGLQVHAQLFLPTTRPGSASRGPAIVFFHGGPQRQMLLGWNPMHAYSEMYAMNQLLASQGYLVLSVNYRGGTGYGMDFREAKGFGPLGASELLDAQAAANYLAGLPDVDPQRIGVYGASYGGLMTALALARAPSQYAAGVDFAGVHDWVSWLGDRLPPEYRDIAWKSSVVSDVSGWRSPVLLSQSDGDQDVPFSQSVELWNALRGGSVDRQQLVFTGEQHDFLLNRSWLTLLSATTDFFNAHLH